SFAYGNENLLLLSPLCLGLLPGAWALLHGREPGTWFRALLVLVVASAVLAGFLKFLPFRPQENVEWVLLLLPLHWALLRRLAPNSAGVPLDQAQGGSPGRPLPCVPWPPTRPSTPSCSAVTTGRVLAIPPTRPRRSSAPTS